MLQVGEKIATFPSFSTDPAASMDPRNSCKYVQKQPSTPFSLQYAAADGIGRKWLLWGDLSRKVKLRWPASARRVTDLLIQLDDNTLLQLIEPGQHEELERTLQVLGAHFFSFVHPSQPELASKITGLLLELPDAQLQPLLEFPNALAHKVKKANWVLRQHGLMPNQIAAKETVLEPGITAKATFQQHNMLRQAREQSRQAHDKHRQQLVQDLVRRALCRLNNRRQALALDIWRHYTVAQTLLQLKFSKAVAAVDACRKALALEVWIQATAHRRQLQARVACALAKLRRQRMAHAFAVLKQRRERRMSLRVRLSQAAAGLQTKRVRACFAGWKSAIALKLAQKRKVSPCLISHVFAIRACVNHVGH